MSEVAYFVASGKRRDYSKSSHSELVQDVNRCFDFLKQLLHEKDQLAKALADAKEKLRWLNLRFWLVTSAVLGEGAVIGWLATELFSRLK